MFISSSLRNIKLLGLFNFFVDFRLYGPVLIIYFAEVSGSYALAGTVMATTMLSSAVLEVPCGVLSDRLGRVRVLQCGAVASVVAVALYGVAPGFWVLMLGAALEGLSRALYSGNNQALLYDSLAEHGRAGEYHRHSGRVGSMFQLALAISALFVGLIAGWSLQVVVLLSIAPQLMSVVVALFMWEPKVHGSIEANTFAHVGQAIRNIRRNRQLRRLVIANAVQSGSGEAAFQLQPAFTNSLWPIWALGLSRTGSHVLSFVSFWFAGRVIDRFGATKTLLVGQLWGEAANLVAVINPTVASPAIIASTSIVHGSSVVSQDALQQREFTDRERATMGSLVTLLASVVFAVTAVGTGALADRYSLQVALLVCQAISIAALPLLSIAHKNAATNPEEGKMADANKVPLGVGQVKTLADGTGGW